jgi:CheY-like chemotaxis protein
MPIRITIPMREGSMATESLPETASPRVFIARPLCATSQLCPDLDAEMLAGLGKKTILLVDDNEPLRLYLRDVLTDAGYLVLLASHAVEAIFIIHKYKAPIDLLLTDIAMPDISGLELVERLRMLNPQLKTLYMSGVVDESTIPRTAPHVSAVYLQKPFSPQVLIQSVRQLTESQPT